MCHETSHSFRRGSGDETAVRNLHPRSLFVYTYHYLTENVVVMLENTAAMVDWGQPMDLIDPGRVPMRFGNNRVSHLFRSKNELDNERKAVIAEGATLVKLLGRKLAWLRDNAERENTQAGFSPGQRPVTFYCSFLKPQDQWPRELTDMVTAATPAPHPGRGQEDGSSGNAVPPPANAVGV